MAKVLILGGMGMLGHKAFQLLSEKHDVHASFRKITDATLGFAPYRSALPTGKLHEGVDAGDTDSISRLVDKLRPDFVINCIGIIKQRAEALDPVTCIGVNSLLPHQLAKICRKHGAKLIHVSTDCVFNGLRGDYTEKDPSDATDLYGKSKHLGEIFDDTGLTLRTSIIGWELQGHLGLLDWFVTQRGGHVKGYANATFSGLTTLALTRVMDEVMEKQPGLTGLWQVAARPIDKFDLISRVNEAMSLGITIDRDEAVRCYRHLNGTAFAEKTGIVVPSWDEMIRDVAGDRPAYEQRA